MREQNNAKNYETLVFECKACNGKGKVYRENEQIIDWFKMMTIIGTFFVNHEPPICKNCKGTGYIRV